MQPIKKWRIKPAMDLNDYSDGVLQPGIKQTRENGFFIVTVNAQL